MLKIQKKIFSLIYNFYCRHPIITTTIIISLLLPPFLIILLDPGLPSEYYFKVFTKLLTQWPLSSIISSLTFFLYPLGFPSDQTGIIGYIFGHYLMIIISFIFNYLIILAPVSLFVFIKNKIK